MKFFLTCPELKNALLQFRRNAVVFYLQRYSNEWACPTERKSYLCFLSTYDVIG